MEHKITNKNRTQVLFFQILGYFLLGAGLIYVWQVDYLIHGALLLFLGIVLLIVAPKFNTKKTVKVNSKYIEYYEDNIILRKISWSQVHKIIHSISTVPEVTTRRHIYILKQDKKIFIDINTKDFTSNQIDILLKQLHHFKTDNVTIEDNIIKL